MPSSAPSAFVARDLEAAGFQPAAEAFNDITNHTAFKAIVARGAQVVWMPALDSEVIERKQLPFGMARDGQVPEGKSFLPIGGLRRSTVGWFLALAEQRHEPVRTWLP